MLMLAGLYILPPKIFEYLEERISNNVRDDGNFQFSPALDRLRKEQKLLGFVLEGQRFDIGAPHQYFETITALHKNSE